MTFRILYTPLNHSEFDMASFNIMRKLEDETGPLQGTTVLRRTLAAKSVAIQVDLPRDKRDSAKGLGFRICAVPSIEYEHLAYRHIFQRNSTGFLRFCTVEFLGRRGMLLSERHTESIWQAIGKMPHFACVSLAAMAQHWPT